MMEIFRNELEANECAFATINSKSRDKNSSQFTSSALFNNSEEKTFYSKIKFFYMFFARAFFIYVHFTILLCKM